MGPLRLTLAVTRPNKEYVYGIQKPRRHRSQISPAERVRVLRRQLGFPFVQAHLCEVGTSMSHFLVKSMAALKTIERHLLGFCCRCAEQSHGVRPELADKFVGGETHCDTGTELNGQLHGAKWPTTKAS